MAVLAAVALVAVPAGCSDEPSPTPAATPTAPSVAEEASGSLGIDIDADTTWQELFDTLSGSEQSCLRSELGNQLGQVLTEPVIADDDPEWSGEVFSCLEADTVRAWLASSAIGGFEQESAR